MTRIGTSVMSLSLLLAVGGNAHAVVTQGQSTATEVASRGPLFLAQRSSKDDGSGDRLVDVSNAAVFRRRIRVNLKGVTRERALVEVARVAELRLTYSVAALRSNGPVTLVADDLTVGAALSAVLYDEGIDVLLTENGRIALVRRTIPFVIQPSGAITGDVRDSATGRGIVGAEVLLTGTTWHTTTDTLGRYRLADVDAGSYSLLVRRLGYAKRSRKVTVGDDREDTVHVVLASAAAKLDELVTTATGRQRRRDIGNSLVTIRADSVMRTGAIRNLTDLLDSRVPGMSLQHTSGAPGDPARIRLRGLGSVMRGNDPVIVVDGVRRYSTQSDARSGNLTNLVDRTITKSVGNAPAPSPLDQIDPNVIEKIEIFKGPSAATLYGPDAANGVIVITTKRGKPGPTRWNASFTYGRTIPAGGYPQGYFRFGHVPSDGVKILCPIIYVRCVQDSLVRYQALNDPDMTILGRGTRSTATLSASGGSSALTYVVAGTYGDETGLLRLPNFERQRFQDRFNREPSEWMQRPHHYKDWKVNSSVTALLGPAADVTLTTMLSKSEQVRTTLENQLAPLQGTYVNKVTGVYYIPTYTPSYEWPGGPSYGLITTSDVVGMYYQRTTASTVTFTTGISGNWRPRTWITVLGRAGLDIVPRDDEMYRPSGLIATTDSGALGRGVGRSLVSTFDLQSTLRRPLKWGFAFEAGIGANVVTSSTNDLVSSASGLVPGTSSLSGATRFSAMDSRVSSSVFGWYIEPRITGQRLSLSTGIRLDGGSAYGARVTGFGSGPSRPGRGFFRSFLRGLLALPKLNGSWVVSEEPWFPFTGFFSSLRLRGAYGQAQVQPGAMDRLRLYTRRINGYGELLDLTNLGNNELRPERSTEFEGGFDADILDSRATLELTLYRKMQVDALMPMAVPVSVNGGGTVIKNIGNILNTGIELTTRITPLQSSLATWSAELSYSRNRNILVKLGPGVERNPRAGLVEGYPIGARWARPILGFADQNDNGVLDLGEVRIGDSLVFMGRLLPSYETSMHTNLALFNGAIAVTAGFTYEAGGMQINQPSQANWVMSRPLADPSSLLSEQASVISNHLTDYGLMQTVSTFRFNSFAVNYRAPTRVTRFLGAQRFEVALQGDNLGIHSSYRGKDPDVTAWSPTENIIDTGQLARPRTWQLSLYLEY